MKLNLIVLAVLVVWDTPASAHPTAPQLVRQAVADGRATGEIEGPIVDEARRRLNATGKLSLDVRRIYLFEQPGCARVQLDFTQDAALLPRTAVPAPYSWSTQLNICADGYPPSTLSRRGK